MASKNQLMVLLLLFNKGPLTVDEIRDITGLKQSSVSNYLRCLSFSNVVFFKEMGRHHFYEFNHDKFNELKAELKELGCKATEPRVLQLEQ